MRRFRGLLCAALVAAAPSYLAAQETSAYSYDVQGRLAGSSVTGGPRSGQAMKTCFDRAGNRINYEVAAAPASCSGSPATFYVGAISASTDLYPNQYVVSADGRFKLIYQTNGNLVLLMNGTTTLWQSGTAGSTVSKASFNAWGQLYIGSASWVWTPATVYGGPYARLQVQNDGNVTAYDASNTLIWQTNTCCH